MNVCMNVLRIYSRLKPLFAHHLNRVTQEGLESPTLPITSNSPFDKTTANMSYEDVLSKARFFPPRIDTPYYMVQLNSSGEKKLDDDFVSDAIAQLISDRIEESQPFSHIFVQTHGWGQSASIAARNPFNRQISGLLDDANRPRGRNFRPLFVCFTWESLPTGIREDKNALTEELITQQILKAEQQQGQSWIQKLQSSLSAAKRRGNERQARRDIMLAVADEISDESEDGARVKMDLERTLSQLEETEPSMESERQDRGADSSKGDNYNDLFDAANKLFNGPLLPLRKAVLNPLQYAVFGRLLKRGRATGVQMAIILKKLMSVAVDHGTQPKVSLSANSAGGHVIVGALSKNAPRLPYKLHTVVFHQGAVISKWFAAGERFAEIRKNVAGPLVATMSSKDSMLRNVFGLVYKDPAIGLVGFPEGKRYDMKSKSEILEQNYEWMEGEMFTIDGSPYINEGPKILGGHGDYHDDESTMW